LQGNFPHPAVARYAASNADNAMRLPLLTWRAAISWQSSILGSHFLAVGKVAEQWQAWMIFHPLRQLST
jgi:hypothetical protein